jgi:CheY-like chemotaxis protein
MLGFFRLRARSWWIAGAYGLFATPIIVVTSYAMMDDREKALAAGCNGCNGCMEKPVAPGSFVAEVEGYAAQKPASSES